MSDFVFWLLLPPVGSETVFLRLLAVIFYDVFLFFFFFEDFLFKSLEKVLSILFFSISEVA